MTRNYMYIMGVARPVARTRLLTAAPHSICPQIFLDTECWDPTRALLPNFRRRGDHFVLDDSALFEKPVMLPKIRI